MVSLLQPPHRSNPHNKPSMPTPAASPGYRINGTSGM